MSKLLFTPGPLTTSRAVKEAMLSDLGSREKEFTDIVAAVRQKLLAVVGAREPAHTAILLPGSGTYAIEATLGSAIAKEGKLLACVNGAYGERIAHIARVLGIATTILRTDEMQPIDVAHVAAALDADRAITHVAVVHCETSTGLLNPVAALAEIVAARDRKFIVDAMSSFAGVSLAMGSIDYLISSANKCVQGVPGFSFVLARRASLMACAGVARSVSLDLSAQLAELDRSGQFRFTPPTHVIVAAQRALDELSEEGGVVARAARYAENRHVLVAGMAKLGFSPLLPEALQSHIITAFHCPKQLDFQTLYEALAARDLIIYPGKIAVHDTFRIGTIGAITAGDIGKLLDAIGAIVGTSVSRA